MKKILIIYFLYVFISCASKSPYNEFETKLTEEICNCMLISNLDKNDLDFERKFLELYSICVKKTSSILQAGLDEYPEDQRLSKEDYLKKLPDLIHHIMRNKCS